MINCPEGTQSSKSSVMKPVVVMTETTWKAAERSAPPMLAVRLARRIPVTIAMAARVKRR